MAQKPDVRYNAQHRIPLEVQIDLELLKESLQVISEKCSRAEQERDALIKSIRKLCD